MSQTRAKRKTGVTPMMAQYMKIRETADDALLFYRMGDFYELFFEDAEIASAALDITLTKRGQHKGKDIPMCGVPVVAAENYLLRLIKKGHRVAVCEQTESPAQAKKRGAKSVVNRKMVRLVTQGTLTEETLLNARSANRLVAMNITASGACSLAWADVSTGEFAAMCFSGEHAKSQMDETLVSLNPSEVLLHPALENPAPLLGDTVAVTCMETANFKVSPTRQKQMATGFQATSLDGFGNFGRAELGALLALYEYIELTQAGEKPKLHPPTQQVQSAHLSIDPATRRSLEITRSLDGTRKGSLLAAVDCTVSASGARLLADRLDRPSLEIDRINQRLDSAAWLLDEPDLTGKIRENLQGMPDLLRAISRLALGRGGPRDLTAAAKVISAGEMINAVFLSAGKRQVPHSLEQDLAAISLIARPKLATLVQDIGRAFVATPAMQERDGGFIARNWSTALDEQCDLRDHSRQRIAKLQGQYIEKTGLSALKIKHNNVLGFFVEVPPKHGQSLLEEPFLDLFRHRQTLASAVRFSTDELAVLEAEILSAGERALALEREIYTGFLHRLLEEEEAELQSIAQALASLDVTQSSARWALSHDGTRPQLDQGFDLEVKHARHPVVEQALQKDGQQVFTPNDCQLGASQSTQARLLFVTGPNMAGKSTWLRQNALLIILAQAGLFVPAKLARFGLVDRLFSRVGASDDLSRGRSTFMVEMIETAAILHQATKRSFVILDEIGRGTATWDGLALAWATAEHLQGVNGCRALFATHYHELTALASRLPGIGNVSLAAREWKGDLVFLHTVVAGAADRSYGIQVAKLSGMPALAIQRAKQILTELESGNDHGALADELPLFAARPEPHDQQQESEIEKRLNTALIDDMSPREALEFVYELRALCKTDTP